jgi:phi13 family phage major tail protein
MANTVKFGLSNCYYSVATESYTSTTNTYSYTYGTPKPLRGAVSLNLSANQEKNVFRADNIDYYVSQSNNGYEGDLELALIPDDFRKDCLGCSTDSNGVLVESVNDKAVAFALLFQFEGDDKARRHVFYNCIASLPDVASQTTEETIDPVTETISVTATARKNDGVVKASTVDGDNSSAQYTGWFSSVYTPVTTS